MDETDQRYRDERIRTERSLLRAILDVVPVSIHAKDVEGRKVVTNGIDLEFSVAEREEVVLGKTDVEIYDKESAATFAENSLSVLHDGVSVVNREE
jgi:hypothetical protein